jgi:hypothetical protein
MLDNLSFWYRMWIDVIWKGLLGGWIVLLSGLGVSLLF